MTNDAAVQQKQRELAELKARVQQLEREITDAVLAEGWQPTGFYTWYYATTGFILGLFGAVVSLLVNVVAAPIAGKDPLEIIRVYLTFPLGEKALQLNEAGGQVYAVGDGMIMAIGCCLYLGTGMLIGVPVYLVLARFTPTSNMFVRLVVVSVTSLAIWCINFYGILSWLQPALFGGNWITDPQYLPWWVAAATHLVFGWTMVLLYPLGQYVPMQRPTE